MQSKILFVGLASAEKFQIEMALSEHNSVFFTAESVEEPICEKIKNPNMIFVKPRDASLIPLISAKISSKSNLRFTPVIYVCEELLSLELEEFSAKEEIAFFINSPIDPKDLKNKINKILQNAGLYEGSHTDKFISLFAVLMQTREMATNAAVSIKSCCDALEIKGQVVVDMTNACKFLCGVAKGLPLPSLIRFFKDMNLATELLQIIDCKPSQCINGAIVYAVLNKELVLLGQEPVLSEFGKNEYIHAMVDAIYENNLFQIEQQSELKFFIYKLQQLLVSSQVAEDTSTTFCDFIRRILSHASIYHLGAAVELEQAEGEIKVHVWPNDKKIIPRCLSKINYEGLSDKQNINFVVNQDESPEFAISLKISKAEPAKEQVASQPTPPAPKPESITPQPPKPAPAKNEQAKHRYALPTTAEEYLRDNIVEPEDVALLSDIEQEVFEIFDVADNKKIYLPYIPEIASHLLKYGSLLIYQHEFSDLAQNLLELSKKILSFDLSVMDEANGRNVMMILESIVLNLQRWRASIFVNQTAEDIHFLDASFEADCDQAMMLFGMDGGEEEGGDIELF